MAEIRNPVDYPVMGLTTLDRAGKRRLIAACVAHRLRQALSQQQGAFPFVQ